MEPDGGFVIEFQVDFSIVQREAHGFGNRFPDVSVGGERNRILFCGDHNRGHLVLLNFKSDFFQFQTIGFPCIHFSGSDVEGKVLKMSRLFGKTRRILGALVIAVTEGILFETETVFSNSSPEKSIPDVILFVGNRHGGDGDRLTA
ncbi:hypothetical protein SDC9_212672 [bioreactor metagenome]|uniref:Uncharacterized protein n=1 Tax=bioreactor metagenome TaxID=1076179 RepID=A0A645JZW7_9ZZZZ